MIAFSNGANPHPEFPLKPPRLSIPLEALHRIVIERIFNNCVTGLREVVVFDGIDILPEIPVFRIRSAMQFHRRTM